jgi:5'-methylthioadenosine phosphorylase
MDAQMDARIAIIGGVGFCLDGAPAQETIETPYGSVEVQSTRIEGEKAVFIARHGENHLPPHKVNYIAILYAVRSSGAARAISINTVGTMSYHPVGSFFLPLDYVEFTKARTNTFFDDRAVHVDMSQPYCPELLTHLWSAMSEMNIQPFEGVYVCAEGPHLESPAQIRMMRQFGDVVGMTGYPEVVLARELGLCYASLCIVTNEACGMKAQGGKLSLSEITEQMDRLSGCVKEIISRTAKKIPAGRSCSCAWEGSSSTREQSQ